MLLGSIRVKEEIRTPELDIYNERVVYVRN